MDFEQTLYSKLSSFEPLKLLIGERIYPLVAPQGAMDPFLTYQLVLSESILTLQGTEAIRKPVYQFNAYSKSYSKLKGIVEQLKAGLKSLVEQEVDTTNLVTQKLKYQIETIDFEPDTKMYQGVLEVEFWL